MGRPLRPASQGAFVKTGGVQHCGGDGNVVWLAAVGRLGQGQFTVTVAEGVGGAAFDQRQRLDRLDGGAGINRLVDIACRAYAPAVGIENGDCAAMAAFHAIAAGDFDEDGIGHSLSNFR